MLLRNKKITVLFSMLVLMLALTLSSVYVQAESVIVLKDKKQVSLTVGEKVKLKVKDAKGKVNWISKNKNIVSVSAKGSVKAKSEGRAKIIAKASGKRYVCIITVKKAAYTFRSDALLTEHFEKHGIAMGYATKEAYAEGANRVIASPEALCKTEAEDGDLVYYLESTNEIVFLSLDGYIRTYFQPDSGIEYYNRQ